MSTIESELTMFAKTLRKQLGTQHLTALAKDTSFSQRSSPFQGKDLVALCGLLSQAVVTGCCYRYLVSTLREFRSRIWNFHDSPSIE